MTALEKHRFEEELDAMTTEELQLILEDQRDLYSKDELELVLDALSYRGNIQPDFQPDSYYSDEDSAPEEEIPAKEHRKKGTFSDDMPDEEEQKPESKSDGECGSTMAPWLEGFAVTTSVLALIGSIILSIRQENIVILLATSGSCVLLMILFFSAAEGLRLLAEIATRLGRPKKKTKK